MPLKDPPTTDQSKEITSRTLYPSQDAEILSPSETAVTRGHCVKEADTLSANNKKITS